MDFIFTAKNKDLNLLHKGNNYVILKKILYFQMTLPELVHSTPQGGTIHKYELSGGKREFLRFLGCYLGSCKFCNDIQEATEYVRNMEVST